MRLPLGPIFWGPNIFEVLGALGYAALAFRQDADAQVSSSDGTEVVADHSSLAARVGGTNVGDNKWCHGWHPQWSWLMCHDG